MKLLRKLKKNTVVAVGKAFAYILDNLAELYTILVIVIVLPSIVGYITEPVWGLLLSFTVQGVVGIFYIRGNK